MSAAAIICFVLFIFLLFSLFRKGTDKMSPGRLFAMVWLLTIGLTELKLSRFQYEWSAYSWFALLVPLLSFLLGVYTVYVLNFNKKLHSIEGMRNSGSEFQVNEVLLFRIIVVLFILYSISFSITYMIRGFVPLLTQKPDIARTQWGIFGIGVFVLSIPAVLYLSMIYLFLVQKHKFKKVIIYIIALIASVTYATLLQRFYLLVPIILTTVLLYYKSNKLRPRNILFALLIFGSVFYGISSIRTSKYVVNIIYYVSQMKFSPKYAVFTEPYMYMTMNLENYASATDKLDEYSYGYYSADFILFATGLKEELAKYMHLAQFPYMIVNSYNTYSMFFIYYRDFGLIGTMIIPMILGIGISTIYYRMRKRPDLNSISLYSLCIFLIFFSFFNPVFHQIHFVFNVVLLYLTTKLISKNGQTTGIQVK